MLLGDFDSDYSELFAKLGTKSPNDRMNCIVEFQSIFVNILVSLGELPGTLRAIAAERGRGNAEYRKRRYPPGRELHSGW